MGRWTWACASQIGTSHVRSGQRLQDAFSCFSCSRDDASIFVGIVSDGAGSAELGGKGASLACRIIGQAARRHFADSLCLPTADVVEYWIDEARDIIYNAAVKRGKSSRDFACTLVCVISDGTNSLVAHIGDGCVVAREKGSCLWFAPTWPNHGEYASTTTFLTDQPTAKLRISQIEKPVDVLALFSDGIERMVLDIAAREPSQKFFNFVAQPVISSAVGTGKDVQLSRHLQEYLGSEQVNGRTDDDKTLVLATFR